MSFLDSLSMNLFDSPMVTNNKKSSSSSSSSSWSPPPSNKTNQQEREGNNNRSSFSNRSYEHYSQKIDIDVFHGAQKSMDSVTSPYTKHPSSQHHHRSRDTSSTASSTMTTSATPTADREGVLRRINQHDDSTRQGEAEESPSLTFLSSTREQNPSSYYMEFPHHEEDHHETRKQQGDEMRMNVGRSSISSSRYDKDHNELENEEEGVQSPFQRTKAVARTDVVITDKVLPRTRDHSFSSDYFSSTIQDEAENQQDEEMQHQNYDDQEEQMLIISKANQQDEKTASCFAAAVADNTSAPMPPPPAADHFLNTSFSINSMAEEYLNPQMEEITKMIHEVEGYLDDLYDIQIKNAVLMDDLVMAGANF